MPTDTECMCSKYTNSLVPHTEQINQARLDSMLIWLAMTGFLIAAYALQIPKGYNQELLVLGIVYVYITCYIIFCHVPTTIITAPWRRGIHAASDLVHQRTSYPVRTLSYGLMVLGVIAATVFSFPEKEESPRLRRLISLFGLCVFVFGTFAASVVGATRIERHLTVLIIQRH